ncbi:MAG: BPL-N domain-containing protein [Mycobacterium sp.]
MTLDRRRFLVAAAGAVGLAVTGCSRPAPVALVYRGPASTPGAPEAVAALLAADEHAMDVRFVGPAEADKLTAAVLSTAVLYVQPGGADNLDAAWEAVAPIASALRSWIHDGGAYLGCCMGGFLAGRDPGFDLLPGNAVEYSTTPGATVNDIADTLITVTWRGQPQAVYFQGGPGFMVNAGPDDTILAHYSNGVVAAGVFGFGRGAVGVTGPHPEAPVAWYTDADLEVPSPLPHQAFADLVTTTLARRR